MEVNPDNISTALSIEDLKSEWCTGFDITQPGVQTITVNYPGAINVVTFNVTVQAAENDNNETAVTDNTDQSTNTTNNTTTSNATKTSTGTTTATTNSNPKTSAKTGVYRKTIFDYFFK